LDAGYFHHEKAGFENEMGLSCGQSLADGLTTATHLFSPKAKM